MDLITIAAISQIPASLDYLAFFDSIKGLTPMALFTIAFLGFLRLIPIVAIAPFFGAKLPEA